MRAAEALAYGTIALAAHAFAAVAQTTPAVDDPDRLGIPVFVDPGAGVYAPPTPRSPSGAPYEPDPDLSPLGQPLIVAPGEGPVYAAPAPRAPSGAPYEPTPPDADVTPDTAPAVARQTSAAAASGTSVNATDESELFDINIIVDPADYLERDPAMTTPLHRAVGTSGDPALIGLLVARGADPDARDADGRTPLHAAAANPLAIVALLKAGADPCATDAAGRPALDAAALESIRRVAPDAYGVAIAAFADCR